MSIAMTVIVEALVAWAELKQWQISTFLNPFSIIVVAVSTSVAAAALIEIFSGMQEAWKRENLQKAFREFFGCGLEDNIDAIVIPRFPTKELKELYPDVYDVDLDKTGATKRLSEVNDMVLAYADVKTASDILIAFSRVDLLHASNMVWDDTMLARWAAKETSEIKTFIVIGLYSNQFFKMICDAPQISKHFKFESIGENAQISIAKRVGDSLDWNTPRRFESDRHDFVLISKLRISDTQSALVIGGLTAKGTERIGEYIRENWQNLHGRVDPSSRSGISIKDNEFAMSVLVPMPSGILIPEDLYVKDLHI